MKTETQRRAQLPCTHAFCVILFFGCPTTKGTHLRSQSFLDVLQQRAHTYAANRMWRRLRAPLTIQERAGGTSTSGFCCVGYSFHHIKLTWVFYQRTLCQSENLPREGMLIMKVVIVWMRYLCVEQLYVVSYYPRAIHLLVCPSSPARLVLIQVRTTPRPHISCSEQHGGKARGNCSALIVPHILP